MTRYWKGKGKWNNQKPKPKQEPYDRAGILSLDILPELSDFEEPKRYRTIMNVPVKITSQRYPVFQRSLICVTCGLKASHFAIERCRFPRSPENKRYHLNLYGYNRNGQEILFTKDHIMPKSKGGTNTQDNYQTMCCNCNSAKGSKVPKHLNTANNHTQPATV